MHHALGGPQYIVASQSSYAMVSGIPHVMVSGIPHAIIFDMCNVLSKSIQHDHVVCLLAMTLYVKLHAKAFSTCHVVCKSTPPETCGIHFSHVVCLFDNVICFFKTTSNFNLGYLKVRND